MSTVFGADARLGEFFAGHGAQADTRPAPYPASRRPQASAASAVMVLQAALGLEADAPDGSASVLASEALTVFDERS